MAVNVELWVDGGEIDGTEEWWDDLLPVLDEDKHRYPMFNTVDPYGYTVSTMIVCRCWKRS